MFSAFLLQSAISFGRYIATAMHVAPVLAHKINLMLGLIKSRSDNQYEMCRNKNSFSCQYVR